DYKAPTCEGELTPPKCTVDEDCEAGCKGQGTLEATCTPPQVEALGTTGDAMLITTLKTNLPAIVNVAAQAKLVADAATTVAGAADRVGSAVADSATCSLKYGASFVTELSGAVAASTTITVSVTASVNVNAAVFGPSGG